MNWLERIAQKPMALPLAVPEDQVHNGIYEVDYVMTEDTAEKFRQEHPELAYGGAGKVGIAYQTGPNEMIKITPDWNEANTARLVFENPMDWVVPVIEEPKMIQENPPLWSIRMKKVEPIEDIYFQSFVHQLFDELKYEDELDVHQLRFLLNEVLERYGEKGVSRGMEIYAQVLYIVRRNKDTLWLTDIHAGNVGWDDDGNLKVFDFGPGKLR